MHTMITYRASMQHLNITNNHQRLASALHLCMLVGVIFKSSKKESAS